MSDSIYTYIYRVHDDLYFVSATDAEEARLLCMQYMLDNGYKAHYILDGVLFLTTPIAVLEQGKVNKIKL